MEDDLSLSEILRQIAHHSSQIAALHQKLERFHGPGIIHPDTDHLAGNILGRPGTQTSRTSNATNCVDNDQRTKKCDIYRETIETKLGIPKQGARRKRRKRIYHSSQGVLEPMMESPLVGAAPQEPSMADNPSQSVPVAPDHLVGSTADEHPQHYSAHFSLFNNVLFQQEELGEPFARWDLLGQPWQNQV
ncbi:hypothetical protein S7711_11422 [Stachybotrys chartarum IBT 7711]|uniref:Uncharacterized protein n=1 Tax=Stachybotrys chartarum (strain CBS 109288 / IBT 7711) TaxID=1280523 RepID=A0A084B809_STACB|nr:hypothetical protein S7711_11422 [Stachybotrys chartarum IBT 7711]